MTKKKREAIIEENSRIMNLASDLDFPWLKDDIKEVPPEDECTDDDLDYPDDEDNTDEFADRYDENEDQSDMPNEEDVNEYLEKNPLDLCYYTFIRKYKNWVEEIKKYCEIFKQRYGVYPNMFSANRITFGRFEDAFDEYYYKPDQDEYYDKRQEYGLDYGNGIDKYPDEAGECFFHGEGYKLRMMENSCYGSGIIKLTRVHGFLSNSEDSHFMLPVGADREKSTHPVIDMAATGKHLEEVMKEEGVSPKIFARIMGWEKPQAIYRWYYGETLPSIDTLSVLARILNRPIENLLVTREVSN